MPLCIICFAINIDSPRHSPSRYNAIYFISIFFTSHVLIGTLYYYLILVPTAGYKYYIVYISVYSCK